MCGIVAAIGSHNIIPLLIDGLNKLEYRGYDSTGIAYLTDTQTIECERSLERVAQLATQINTKHITANLGIAHTRWATHGAPALRNAHPMVSNSHDVSLCLVHNGIIENFEEIKLELSASGYVFTSDTDTEVMTHLIHQYCVSGLDLYEAVFQATKRLRGLYAIAVMRADEPHKIVGARQGAPLLIGVGEHGNYLASDTSALLSETRNVVYLEEGDVVEISLTAHRIRTKAGDFVEREIHESHLSADAVSLGRFSHYMQKETFEQPEVVANTLEMVAGAQSISPNLFGAGADVIFANTQNILILACGTSYHAAMVARYWLEELAQIPVNVEALGQLRTLSDGFARSQRAKEILEAVKAGAARDPKTLPKIERTESLSAEASATLELLKVLLKAAAAEHGVAPRIIASSEDLEQLAMSNEADILALQGWRRALFGEAALKLKRGELALTLVNGEVRAVPASL